MYKKNTKRVFFSLKTPPLLLMTALANCDILLTCLSKVSCSKEAHAFLSFSHKSPVDIGQNVLISQSISSHRSLIGLRLPLRYLKRFDSVSLWVKNIYFEAKHLEKYIYISSNPNEVFPNFWPAVHIRTCLTFPWFQVFVFF